MLLLAWVSLLFNPNLKATTFLPSLRDRYGFIDTPISTKDDDHPAVKTVKNVVENIGFDIIGDVAIMAIGSKIKGKGVDDALRRDENVKAQYEEVAKSRKDVEGFDPYRDKAIGTDTQGNINSTADGPSITKQLDRIDNSWDSEYGSTDSPLTQRQLERMSSGADGEPQKVIAKLVQDYRNNDAYKQAVKDLKAGRKSLSDIRADGIARFKEIAGNPRDLEQLDVDELLKKSEKNIISGQAVLQPEDVLVFDMLAGGMAKQIRDLGIAAREVKGYVDYGEAGGVIDSLKEKLTALMIATKRARYMAGTNLKGFDAATAPTPAQAKKAMKEIDSNTKQQIESLFSMFDDDPNGELFEAVLEAMSMSNKITNLKDFDAFMRSKLTGEKFLSQSIITKELGATMVHSILSGPKTPVRAALGTGIAASSRMVSQALGATIRGTWTGDWQTAKSSIASVNAMVQAIPEAWDVFKTKLNGYWSGDIAQTANRFSDYKPSDENWEAFGKWANTPWNRW